MKTIMIAAAAALALFMTSCGETTPAVDPVVKNEILQLDSTNAVLEQTTTEIDAATEDLENAMNELDNL